MYFDAPTGWWLPDVDRDDGHLVDWMTRRGDWADGRLLYQGHKYRRAVELLEGRHGPERVAVDIGAHVGLWSWQMARDFGAVVAVEPVPEHQECWRANMSGFEHPDPRFGSPPLAPPAERHRLLPFALGSSALRVHMRRPPEWPSSGSTMVDLEAAGGAGPEVSLVSGDDLLGAAFRADLIKIDCEGYELPILQGLQGVLARNRPVLVVEQKPDRATRFKFAETAAIGWLLERRYRCAAVISGDYFMVPAR